MVGTPVSICVYTMSFNFDFHSQHFVNCLNCGSSLIFLPCHLRDCSYPVVSALITIRSSMAYLHRCHAFFANFLLGVLDNSLQLLHLNSPEFGVYWI